jgi:hypothetical protein
MRRTMKLLAAVLGASLIAGCTAGVSASVGIGTSDVPRSTVEHNVAAQLAAERHQPLPNISCPGDLPARVGAKIVCVLTAQGSTTRYAVTVTVNSLSGTTAHFTAQVADKPMN